MHDATCILLSLGYKILYMDLQNNMISRTDSIVQYLLPTLTCSHKQTNELRWKQERSVYKNMVICRNSISCHLILHKASTLNFIIVVL